MSQTNKVEARLLRHYAKWLWFLRMRPDWAARWLTGIVVPPHERFGLGLYFSEYRENNLCWSRGTSKTFGLCSLAAPLKALLYKNLSILTLSASGFRGGKEIFRDSQRLFEGQLKSQVQPGEFLTRSAQNAPKVIAKDPSIWTIALKSHSRYSTAPTNNAESLRGLRANIVNLDERNYFPDGQAVVHGIVRPMLNVGQDFLRTASGSDHNQIFQISTIDLTVRDWYPEIQQAELLARREYEAMRALKGGDGAEYDRLLADQDGALRGASFSYSRLDYTDLLIPEWVGGPDGERYRVAYPVQPEITKEDLLKEDPREGVSYFFTYPVDKEGLEAPLFSGVTDREVWLAEQRNCFIQGAGNVFEWDLLQKVTERPIYEAGKIKGYENLQDEFYAPILYSCGDPCVVGVDVARESDETAFVVLRLGEMAEGKFDPTLSRKDSLGRPCLGQTPWNHVLWAESWKNLEYSDAAEKIRELFERYHIVSSDTLGGIGMDARGGGSAVRDFLGNPKPPLVDGRPDPAWNQNEVLKLFDPEDKNGFGHYAAFNDPRQYWGGLRLLATTNTDNLEWTYGTRALMQQKKLYLGFWQPASRWAEEMGFLTLHGEPDRSNPEFLKHEIGYTGIRRLRSQLLRLQIKRTETGAIRFTMPGDRDKEEGKKDLYVALTYAVHLARQHLLSLTKDDDNGLPPDIAPLLVQVGSGGGGRDVRNYHTLHTPSSLL